MMFDKNIVVYDKIQIHLHIFALNYPRKVEAEFNVATLQTYVDLIYLLLDQIYLFKYLNIEGFSNVTR